MDTASRTGKGLLRSETDPVPDALLPQGTAHRKPGLLLLAGSDTRGAGGLARLQNASRIIFGSVKQLLILENKLQSIQL